MLSWIFFSTGAIAAKLVLHSFIDNLQCLADGLPADLPQQATVLPLSYRNWLCTGALYCAAIYIHNTLFAVPA